uniref:Transposable element P transposase-like RNase H C-terminal domain-containing protein n=1 Tax=Photinus pyralis TaxID=7054 RepID=A0A1Y1N415_PHOPY
MYYNVKSIQVVDRTFDIMNSIDMWGTGFKAPIREENREKVLQHLHLAIHYFKTLKLSNQQLIYKSKRKVPIVGIILDWHSVISLAEELIWSSNAPMQFLLCRSISQDHVETFFSSIRKRTGKFCTLCCYFRYINFVFYLGNNNNPTPMEFRSSYRKCILGRIDPNIIGNCEVVKENFQQPLAIILSTHRQDIISVNREF